MSAIWNSRYVDRLADRALSQGHRAMDSALDTGRDALDGGRDALDAAYERGLRARDRAADGGREALDVALAMAQRGLRHVQGDPVRYAVIGAAALALTLAAFAMARTRKRRRLSQDGSTSSSGWNRDRIEGNWHQMKGQLREKWARLTDDDVEQLGGRMEQLAGRIQERYGITREEAEQQVRQWQGSTGSRSQSESRAY